MQHFLLMLLLLASAPTRWSTQGTALANRAPSPAAAAAAAPDHGSDRMPQRAATEVSATVDLVDHWEEQGDPHGQVAPPAAHGCAAKETAEGRKRCWKSSKLARRTWPDCPIAWMQHYETMHQVGEPGCTACAPLALGAELEPISASPCWVGLHTAPPPAPPCAQPARAS